MNSRALRVLEYDKITDLLCKEATSAPGRELCRTLTPSSKTEQITLRLTQTEDAVSRLVSMPSSPSFGHTKDFSQQLSRLSIGAGLHAGELLSMASFLENTGRIKNFGRNSISDKNTEGDSLTPFFEELMPLSDISAQIRKCILSEDEIADDATLQLYQIRKKKISMDEKIHSHLNSMVNGSARTYLQDPVITQRNGRYCLPVKAEHKGSVPGIVHERSSTGSTLFIEPSAVVDYNNKIRELEQQEKDEIEVLLFDLSSLMFPYTNELSRNCYLMGMLDFIFAKGRLALSMNASRPVCTAGAKLNLRKARHPLLAKDSVVPIDLELPDDTMQMVITGPNTGGKTVTLKTVGLFALMGQAGLFIPAGDRSSLPVFREIYADIGDEQSIEQNLSTFSSHMTNIVSILKDADREYLCLFDELCSGTDPDEGAVLAISILEALKTRKGLTLATTHYSELKLYALGTPGVVNACCEFDVSSLRPTYRLLIGIPGKSNAFAISQKLGLPSYIIENAKKKIGSEQESFEDVLSDLENERVRMEEQRLESDELSKDLKARMEALEKKELELEKRRNELLEAANIEAREILMEAKEMADESIRSFRGYTSQTPAREMEQKRAALREKIDEKNRRLTVKKPDNASKAGKKADPALLKTGDSVKVLSLNMTGTVASLPDAKGYVFVQCGSMKSRVSVNDLVMSDAPEPEPSEKKCTATYGRMAMGKSMNVSTQINLLGMTTDEAITALDKYLDDACIANIPTVRVVHGKGTGALRNAVHRYLRTQKRIKEYRVGEFGEGDAGVTIVTFR